VTEKPVGDIEKFQEERQALNELVMKYAGTGTKRFYSLDAQAYREGALPEKTKELLGLVASFVLRCDDCIKYHIIRCHEAGVSSEELEEALFIGLIVGGTITIPHQRRAMKVWDALVEQNNRASDPA
jgi:AhpD family alkylhydroperoxidase